MANFESLCDQLVLENMDMTNTINLTREQITSERFPDDIIHQVTQQLFGFDNQRFCVIRVPCSEIRDDWETNIDHCFDFVFDKSKNLLESILEVTKTEEFQEFNYCFSVVENYSVAGAHKKFNPDGTWPASGRRSSLRLHWDPLSVPILGTVYHRDRDCVGGHALVADIARYLKDHGGQITDGVYACELHENVRHELENPKYMKRVYLPHDCITIQLCNNHINMSDYRQCGVLHTNQASDIGNRRVAVVSIQDTSASYGSFKHLLENEGLSENFFVNFPYITPPFRSNARASFLSKTISGYWDGALQEGVYRDNDGVEIIVGCNGEATSTAVGGRGRRVEAARGLGELSISASETTNVV